MPQWQIPTSPGPAFLISPMGHDFWQKEREREPELPSSASVDAVCIYPREVKLALLFRATTVCEVQSSRLSRISLLARIVSRVDVSNTKRSDEMNLDDSLFASRPDVMRLICWQRVEGSGF